jgi:tetrapyrrole methylase family protein/MazG family protein
MKPEDLPTPPLERLRAIVACLRAPGGCPWDREQTHGSLRAALIEEAYEVLAAIDASDDANLSEELGDLLLHVVMHAQIGSERGAFDFEAIAQGIGDKMIRRHPHVFGDGKLADSAAVLQRWDQIKREEKGSADHPVMAGLMNSLPALMRAQKAQEKAARVGFDWRNVADVFDKVREEVEEVASAGGAASEKENRAEDAEALAGEIGDLLFSVVNLARWHKFDSERLLAQATDKFIRRFEQVEDRLRSSERRWENVSLADMDALWDDVKRTERNQRPDEQFPVHVV